MSDSRSSASQLAFSSPQVNLYTNRIEASSAFYRHVLGFEETFRTPRDAPPAHVELRSASLPGLRLGVATLEALRRDHGISTGSGPPRLEVVLMTEDVDGAYAWATAKGAPSVGPPHDFGGYLRSARVADPDGNPVVFSGRLPVAKAADPTVRPVFRNHLVNLYSANIARSLCFYRDLLGSPETFRVPREGPPDHVELELGPLNLAVSTLEALRRDHGLSGGGGPPRGELVLWVPDVDFAYSWLGRQGVQSLSRPHDFAGTLRGAWVADPDGNPVQLVARRSVP